MTFGHPLLLLTLLVLPLAVALYLWLDRRRVRHAMTFTNLDVLASVAPARSSAGTSRRSSLLRRSPCSALRSHVHIGPCLSRRTRRR